MTQRLALDLTQTQASLLGLRDGDWILIGQTDLSGDDLHDRLTKLLSSVLGVGSNKAPELLVSLPSDQVIYTVLVGPLDTDDEATFAAVSQEITTRFPQCGAQPQVDWHPKDQKLQIAATAQSVLREAVEFLTACGIAPTAFTARPNSDQFSGQPDLGSLNALQAQQAWPLLPDPNSLELTSWAENDDAAKTKHSESNARIVEARKRATEAAQKNPTRMETLEELEAREHNEAQKKLLKKIVRRKNLSPLSKSTIGLLTMTGVLVIALSGFAFWPASNDAVAPETEQHAEAPIPQAPAPVIVADAPEESSSLPARLITPEILSPPIQSAVEAALEEAVLQEEVIQPPAPITASEPLPALEDTSLYYTPPPVLAQMAYVAGLDDLNIPGIDPSFRTDALALPKATTWLEEARPEDLQPPGPASQVYVVDSQGLIKPSAEGTLSPEGFLVFAGKPPSAPGQRPALDEERIILTVLRRADLPEDDPLRQLSPRVRPEYLTDNFERATLGGRTQTELARFRPVQRPQSQQQLAEETAAPGGLAIASTPRPTKRSAKAAQRFASAAASAKTPVTPVRAADVAKPSKPSPANVEREATSNSGINLKSMNLLGTFGPRGKNRALVRLPSGRVVNVAVGDRIDGGRVSTISQGKLSYVKSGRSISLSMPRG